MVSKVYMICNAYESGIGHGLKKDGVSNPYASGTDEHEAWGTGYAEGIERAAEKVKVPLRCNHAWSIPSTSGRMECLWCHEVRNSPIIYTSDHTTAIGG